MAEWAFAGRADELGRLRDLVIREGWVRARLTPAERETAVLAASGRSNVEIAEALYLSRRTVENSDALRPGRGH